MNDSANLEQSKPVEVNNSENSKLKVDTDERHREVSDSSMSLLHLPCNPLSNETTDKVQEEQLISIEHRRGNARGFEELRLEEIEPLKYCFADGQKSDSLQEVPMELANSVEIEGAFGSSDQFESGKMKLDMAARHQLSTVCVWCGVEFNHDAVDSKIQSDSVGFMCPTCKARISGQVDVLDNGSPVNPHTL